MTWQYVIVGGLILLAGAHLLRVLRRTLTRPTCGHGCGCEAASGPADPLADRLGVRRALVSLSPPAVGPDGETPRGTRDADSHG